MLASTAALYAGGALYYAALSLPHLGDFAVMARLGTEPIGNASRSNEAALLQQGHRGAAWRSWIKAAPTSPGAQPQRLGVLPWSEELAMPRLGPIQRRHVFHAFNPQAHRCSSSACVQRAWYP